MGKNAGDFERGVERLDGVTPIKINLSGQEIAPISEGPGTFLDGDFVCRNQGQEILFTAATIPPVPIPPGSITWQLASNSPGSAGSLINPTLDTVTFTQAANYFSNNADDVTLTALFQGVECGKLSFSVVEVVGTTIVLCNSPTPVTASSHPAAQVATVGLASSVFTALENYFNGLSLSSATTGWSLQVNSGGGPDPSSLDMSSLFSSVTALANVAGSEMVFTVTTQPDIPKGDYTISDPFGHREHIIVVEIDVDADLNNDGDFNNDDEALEVVSPGKVICLNDNNNDGDNDNNNDGVEDDFIDLNRPVTDPELTTADSDLKQLFIIMDPIVPTAGIITLEATPNLRIWDRQTKRELLPNIRTWDLSDPVDFTDFDVKTRDTLWVEGIATGDGEIIVRYGGCEIVHKYTVTKVGMTAYRPQTEGPGYAMPFQKTEVPDDEEESSGAGVRVNGDDDNGNGIPDLSPSDMPVTGENDLIEVLLEVGVAPAPAGMEYVLKRNNSAMKIWEEPNKTTAVLTSGTEAVLAFPSTTKTVWVESTGSSTTDIELLVRPTTGGADICSDKVHFYSFTSIVISLGGEGHDPSDPADPNHGVFGLAIELYQQGYDVHMYNDDNVDGNGAGPTYDEVVSAIQSRNVAQVAIFGYSHGGGSTHDLAERLTSNSGSIGTFSIPFTAYIDAVAQPLAAAENRRPPGSAYHVNYFQEGAFIGPWADLGLDGGPIDNPPGADHEVNVDAGGQMHTHGSIDDDPVVLNDIETRLTSRVAK